MKFKVGNWVRIYNTNESSEYLSPVMEEEVIRGKTAQTDKHRNLLNSSYLTVEYWEPKEGEWCWFWDFEQEIPKLMQFKEMFNGDLFTSIQDRIEAYTYCEPFLGKLPSFIKDK